jgi:hypothetical protein
VNSTNTNVFRSEIRSVTSSIGQELTYKIDDDNWLTLEVNFNYISTDGANLGPINTVGPRYELAILAVNVEGAIIPASYRLKFTPLPF